MYIQRNWKTGKLQALQIAEVQWSAFYRYFIDIKLSILADENLSNGTEISRLFAAKLKNTKKTQKQSLIS